jgi:hypothetical protein
MSVFISLPIKPNLLDQVTGAELPKLYFNQQGQILRLSRNCLNYRINIVLHHGSAIPMLTCYILI